MVNNLVSRLRGGKYTGADLSLAYETWQRGLTYQDPPRDLSQAIDELQIALREEYDKVTQDTKAPSGKLRVCLRFWVDDVLMGNNVKAKVNTSDVLETLGTLPVIDPWEERIQYDTRH